MTTNGIKFYYAPEATAGTQPTTGWIEIPNVVSWGEIGSSPDTIDITPISETDFKQYEQGLSDTGSVDVTGNWENDFIDAWETIREAAATAKAAGKALWFTQIIPGYDKSFYYAGSPSMLRFPEVGSNSALQPSGTITVKKVTGLATKPTIGG